jgi:hypothetical protein
MQALAEVESLYGEPANALELFSDAIDSLSRASDIITTMYGYLCVLFDRLGHPATAATLYGAGGEPLRIVTFVAGLPAALLHLRDELGELRYHESVRTGAALNTTEAVRFARAEIRRAQNLLDSDASPPT